MDDEILRKYGLSEAWPQQWADVDASTVPIATSANESDALGTGQSVAAILHDRGIRKSEVGIPQEYSTNSKHFNARAYIRDVHRKATQNDLRRGQDYLGKAIDSKSTSLKGLVEDNFDRFVGSKRVIDNVYAQLFSEFGKKDQAFSRLDEIRDSLNDTSARAAQVFEPVIENRRKSDKLRATLAILEQHQAHFDLPSILLSCIERNDDDALIREYKKGQLIFQDIRGSNPPMMTTAEKRNTRVLSRVWNEVERIMRTHELDVWRKLEEQRQIDNAASAKLANFLLEVGVDSNPYHRAYNQNNLRIKESMTVNLEVERTQVEILRRNLELKSVFTQKQRVDALRAFINSENSPSETVPNIIQSQDVLAFWDSLTRLVQTVWTRQVSQIMENWRIVQDMTSGKTGKLLPNGPDGQSRKFHSFSPQELGSAVVQAEETIQLLCDLITDFFNSKPISELPSIYSPISATTPGTPYSPINSVHREAPELPDLGDRELPEFSFIPKSANSLGASVHLNQLMKTIMKGVEQLGGLHISSKIDESLKAMLTTIRERLIRALCDLWQADSDLVPQLETWVKVTGADGTALPKALAILQKAAIEGIKKIAFGDDNSSNLLPPPSSRLINNIRQQFYKILFQTVTGLLNVSTSSPASTTSETSADEDFKKLLTLSNFKVIQTTTLINLVQQFEHSFRTSLTEDLHKLNQLITSSDSKLYQNYLTPRLHQLETTITDAFSSDWRRLPFPVRTSEYCSSLILQLIETHAMVSGSSPNLIPRIIPSLVAQCISLISAQISRLDRVGMGTVLQVTLDLEILTYAFGDAMSGEAGRLVDSVFRILDERSDRGESEVSGDRPDMKKVLGRSRKGIAMQARVFRKNGGA